MPLTALEQRTIRIPLGARTGPAQEPIYGYREVSAYCIKGLAVHRALNPKARWKWWVTVEASGLRIDCLGGPTKAVAEANMRAVAALDFDWTGDEAEVVKRWRARPDVIEAIRRIGDRN
jgi:hypothetical protein